MVPKSSSDRRELLTMLSAETQAGLARLEALQSSYRVNAEIAQQLRQKDLYCMVGPSCVGKSFVMDAVVSEDSSVAIAGTLTSRPSRPDDAGKPYRYIDHTDSGLQPLFQKVTDREVVQFGIHPATKHLYGTELQDYPGDITVMDVLASSIDGLKATPYKLVTIVGIVTDPHVWWSRLDERFPVGHADRIKRQDEAVTCLHWMLSQPEGTVHLVHNADDDKTAAARHILNIIKNGDNSIDPQQKPINRQIARMMITHTLEMQSLVKN